MLNLSLSIDLLADKQPLTFHSYIEFNFVHFVVCTNRTTKIGSLLHEVLLKLNQWSKQTQFLIQYAY